MSRLHVEAVVFVSCHTACAGRVALLAAQVRTVAEIDRVALGVCLYWTRVGMDSYQRPSVAYGSAGKPK